MVSSRNARSGIASAVALIALVIGAPALLMALGGVPFASGLPSLSGIGDALGRQMTYSEVNVLLAIVGWLLWAQFTWCVVAEFRAWRHNRSPRSVPLAVGSQTLARTLVLSVVVLFGSFARPSVAPDVRIVATPAVAVSEASPEAPAKQLSTPADVEKTVTVKPRDDLWGIAEKHLGDPLRWHEIYELNKGVPQKDGRSLQQGHLIRPGWVLKLPADATGVEGNHSPEVPMSSPVVVPSTPTTEPAPTTTTTTLTTAVTSTTEVSPALSTSVEEDGNSESSLPAGIAASGVTAAGVLLTLMTLRRVQQRHRKPGQVVAAPESSLAPVESALRIAADASDATRLDIASRALGFWLSEGACEQLPRIDAVRVGKDGIEFLFASAVDAPPGPFTMRQNQRAWTLRNDVHEVRVGSMAQLMSSLLPALTTVGSVDDASVMIDLESSLWTTVVGSDGLSRQFLDAVVMELATNVWSDYLTVVVVGGDERQGRFERAIHCNTVKEATSHVESAAALSRQLDEAGLESTLLGRIVPGNDGWVPTILVVREPIASDAVEELLSKVGLSARKGFALLTLGEHSKADRTIVVSDDSVRVTPPDIAVERAGLATADVSVVHDLLDDAEEEPVDVEAAVIDLRGPSADESEPATTRVRVHKPDNNEVLVRVLGPVTIEGGNAPIDRPKSVELVAYLALHPNGVTDERLKTALWPEKRVSPGSFHSTTSRARSKLGEATDGTPHLPSVSGGTYRVGESVAVDAALFQRAVAAADDAVSVKKAELLTSALEYVKGAPFSDTSRGYQWAYNEGIVGHLESTVANAAHALAELAFEMCDNERGHWAARQGVLASPGWEPLYRLRMIAYDREGNPAGVRSVMDELIEVVEAIEPYDSLHPETVQLWQQLDPRQRASSARR